VTVPVRVPPAVESLIRAVAGGSAADRDQRASTFARGLALGALVGAAIAGSTIWQRRQAKGADASTRAAEDAPREPAEDAFREPAEVPPG
jgi:hypothetical protein